MEIRKIHKHDNLFEDQHTCDLEKSKKFKFSKNAITKVIKAIKIWHKEDFERIKLLPQLNIVKCKNLVCKSRFESTSTAPTLSNLSIGCSTKEIKKEIYEDNES